MENRTRSNSNPENKRESEERERGRDPVFTHTLGDLSNFIESDEQALGEGQVEPDRQQLRPEPDDPSTVVKSY